MKYGDPDHMIMKYFAKIRESGKIGTAHLTCLKETGNDFAALSSVNVNNEKVRKGEKPIEEFSSEIKSITDAEFDLDKLKALFVERKTMTSEQFDDGLKNLRNTGLMDKNNAEATDAGVLLFRDMENVRIAEQVALGLIKG